MKEKTIEVKNVPQIQKKTQNEIQQIRDVESWNRFLAKKGIGYLRNPTPDCHFNFDSILL